MPVDRAVGAEGIALRLLFMTLPLLMTLAACTDAPPPALGPQQGVRASFPPGGVTGVIQIDALDALPLHAAELVAPDGTATPASYLDVTANPRTLGGTASITDPWRASMLGGNGIDPTLGTAPSPVVRAQERILLTSSTADITLPDPVAYGRDWTGYKIRLSFGPSGGDVREIAAPQPPPQPTGS
jgi:hypothetical protein